MNRISYDLNNLNGIKIADLENTLKKLEEKQANHNPHELLAVTKCRLKFIEQLKAAIKPKKRVKRGTYDKYKDLVIKDITKKQWRKFYQKYMNNITFLKRDDISDERRKRLIEFNAWYSKNRPARGKRGRPKKCNSTVH